MLRFYGVDQPLLMPWRRFINLVGHMPPSSSLYALLSHREPSVSEMFDKMHGRRYDEVKQVGLSEFMAEFG